MVLDRERIALKQVVEKRGITRLCHFTKAGNLESILNHGLLLRHDLNHQTIKYSYNDDMRLDGKEAICLSVTFPNYKMFYKYRKQNENEKWVVLCLKPDIIWEKNCAFYPENAASANVSGLPIEHMRTFGAFENMFYELLDGNSRQARGLKNCDATNPQAEILCFEKIDSSYILGIGDKSFFDSRSDYGYWKKLPEISFDITFG